MTQKGYILTLLASYFLTFNVAAQTTCDFEPCIGYGGSEGLQNLRLLLATSSDGINWTRTNRVLSDRSSVADAIVLPSGRILVYYVAGCAQLSGSSQTINTIKVAVSDDNGLSWSYRDVLFNNVPTGGTLPVDPNVVLLENGDINMLVTIDPDQTGSQSPCSYSALSVDGGFTYNMNTTAVYTISGTNILDPENFRFGDNNWKLWAGGVQGRNLLGISTDEGASFTNQGEYCTSTNTDVSSECYVTADVVKYDSATYKMYAFGTSSNGQIIRSLTSTDGIDWTLDDQICLTVNSSTGVESYDVWAPTVVKLNDGSFLMVYETKIPAEASTESTSLKLINQDTTLYVGDTLQLYAYSYFPDQSIRDNTFFGSWVSTQPDIASISFDGKLTALLEGDCSIYQTDDSLCSDSIVVTIVKHPVAIEDCVSGTSCLSNNLISKGFTIYPDGVSHVIIYNSNGQVCLNQQMADNTFINSSDWSSGIYFLKMISEKKTIRQKLVKK